MTILDLHRDNRYLILDATFHDEDDEGGTPHEREGEDSSPATLRLAVSYPMGMLMSRLARRLVWIAFIPGAVLLLAHDRGASNLELESIVGSEHFRIRGCSSKAKAGRSSRPRLRTSRSPTRRRERGRMVHSGWSTCGAR